MKKRLTRGQAIMLFCHECMGFDRHRTKGTGCVSYHSAGFEVSKCPDNQCPLWVFRLGREIEETIPKEPVRSTVGAHISA